MNENRKVTVYGIVHKDHPEDIRYIGQTVDLRSRKSCHRTRSKRGDKTALYDWMRKHEGRYGYLILNEDATWNETEIGLIRSFRGFGHSLLNLTDGGDGTIGHKQSIEHIEKVQKARAGYRHSEETKRRISEGNTGKKHPNKRPAPPISEETRQRYIDSHKGIRPSEETKKKMSVANMGRKMPNRKPFSDDYKKEQSQRMKIWWKKRKEVISG